jgi:hypothetical protein
MLVAAVTAGILHPNLVTPMGGVPIILSVGIREVMERMSDLPTPQTQIPPGTITTVRKGM